MLITAKEHLQIEYFLHDFFPKFLWLCEIAFFSEKKVSVLSIKLLLRSELWTCIWVC